MMNGTKRLLLTALLFMLCAFCLCATTSTSIKYELWVERVVPNQVSAVYFADVTGAPLGSGSYLAIDLTKTVSDIQYLVGVDNNLTEASSGYQVSLTFESFKMQNSLNKNELFRGGYVFSIWRYMPVIIPVVVDGETYNWVFQAQPSTSYQANAFPDQLDGESQVIIPSGTVRLNQTPEVSGQLTTNNSGTDRSTTVSWAVDKTNHPMGESRIWYYGVGLQFIGDTSFGTINDLRSYPPGGELVARVTITLSAL